MRFVTFNIRYDCGRDGINDFDCRKGLILEVLGREEPDIVCFQEVLPHVAAWLKSALPDYYVVGCPREADLTGEQAAVAFRRDRYSLMKLDTFWLSPTPRAPGSRYPEQSCCPRTCTEAVLLENASGRVLRVMNTHLDHEGEAARLRGAEQILARLAAEDFFPQAPVFLAGDMNAAPDSREMALLRAALREETAGTGATFHNFGRGPEERIDYIFTRGPVACRSVKRWTDCREGVYLSDHYPVAAEFVLT